MTRLHARAAELLAPDVPAVRSATMISMAPATSDAAATLLPRLVRDTVPP